MRVQQRRELALARHGIVTLRLPFGGPFDLITRLSAAAFARRTHAMALVAWMNRAARHSPATSSPAPMNSTAISSHPVRSRLRRT